MGAAVWEPLANQVALVARYAREAQQADSDAQVQARLARQSAIEATAAAEQILAYTPQPPWVAMGIWAPGTAYTLGPPPSYVVYEGNGYVCNTTHVSGVTFNSDYWVLVIDTTTAVNTFFATLPTSPGSAGTAWLNGGVVMVVE